MEDLFIIEIEKAYIARIIDGEGSIMLQKFHSNQLPSPCVSIASTTLEWIVNITNVGVIKRNKNYNPQNTRIAIVIFKYDDAINLIRDVYPYIVIKSKKKKRAELIINKYKSATSRNGRYSKEMFEAKKGFMKSLLQ